MCQCSYTLTKAIAENLLVQEGRDLPACILRPTIVGPAMRQPHVGWLDSLIGPGGLVLAAALGILRVMQGDANAIVDLVPVDHVCNAIIAAAWSVGRAYVSRESGLLPSPSQVLPIYVVGTSQHNPLQWRWLIEVMKHVLFEIWFGKRDALQVMPSYFQRHPTPHAKSFIWFRWIKENWSVPKPSRSFWHNHLLQQETEATSTSPSHPACHHVPFNLSPPLRLLPSLI
jgi:nucleoside-diphosphate-sugar epimerase